MIVPKREKDISEIDKIINMYSLGISTRYISKQIKEIYECEVSETNIGHNRQNTTKNERMENKTLGEIYPIIYCDSFFSKRKIME